MLRARKSDTEQARVLARIGLHRDGTGIEASSEEVIIFTLSEGLARRLRLPNFEVAALELSLSLTAIIEVRGYTAGQALLLKVPPYSRICVLSPSIAIRYCRKP